MSRLEKVRKKESVVHSRTEQDREPLRIPWFKSIIVLVLVCTVLYTLFFSGFFKVKNIKVEGYAYPEKVTELASEQLKNQIVSENIFFFREKRTEEALYGDSTIEGVDIKKIFPGTLKIIIKESRPAMIWSTRGENYFINEGGVVTVEGADQKYVTVYDATNLPVKRGDRVASPTFIKFITKTAESFESQTGVEISKILIFDILSDVHILTTDGWTVYLDSNKDPDAQLKNLARVLEVAKKDGKKLTYIDLRLHTKAFYK